MSDEDKPVAYPAFKETPEEALESEVPSKTYVMRENVQESPTAPKKSGRSPFIGKLKGAIGRLRF